MFVKFRVLGELALVVQFGYKHVVKYPVSVYIFGAPGADFHNEILRLIVLVYNHILQGACPGIKGPGVYNPVFASVYCYVVDNFLLGIYLFFYIFFF